MSKGAAHRKGGAFAGRCGFRREGAGRTSQASVNRHRLSPDVVNFASKRRGCKGYLTECRSISVFRGPSHVIDDEYLNRNFLRFQLQPELLLNRRDQ
jgi:hypothetical protein